MDSPSPDKITKERRKDTFVPCDICFSFYKAEIEAAMDNKIPLKKLAEKYKKLFIYGEVADLYFNLARHYNHLSEARLVVINYRALTERTAESNKRKVTIETLAQKLLEVGDDILEQYTADPKEAMKHVNMNHVFSAQKVLLEKKRVKVEEDALKLGMAKLFSGLSKPNIIEGEITDAKVLEKFRLGELEITKEPEKNE
jgi:hypothetical protein